MKYRKSPTQIEKLASLEHLSGTASSPRFANTPELSDDVLNRFEQSNCGKVVWPWSEGYETDSQDFNNVYPASPTVIVYAVCYADIQACLDLAKGAGLQITIRSGGHSLADYSICDGVVVDMSELNGVYVYPSEYTAIIEAGARFENIFPKLEDHGLHMPGGGCPTVAVAGFMQGGGYGLTSRNYGMNCDNVLEVSVMLADGTIVIANESQNSDLFWAVRGGTGGNFGVLLSIKYRLHALGDIYGIKLMWDIENNLDIASQVLTTIQNTYLTDNTLPQMGIETVLTTDTDGRKKIMFCSTWIGDKATYENELAPLYAIPGYQIACQAHGPYSKVNAEVLEGTPDLPMDIKAYSRSAYIARELTQEEWKSILAYFLTCPNQYTMVDMECYGGRINQIPADDSAFIHRDVKMDFFCDAFFDKQTNDQQKNEQWLEAFYQFLKPYTNGHSYQNYPNRNQSDYRFAYWGNQFQKLLQIKNKYDPENLFWYQQSISPLE